MIEIGDIYSRYLVLSRAGNGGMSFVYKVKDMRLGVIRAMKEVSVKDSVLLSSAFAEMSALREINHPSFPMIVDIVRSDTSYLLIMEYIEGVTLEEYRKRNRADEEKVIAWAFEILEGLRYLHTRKPPIIHGDLKPSNIMITNEGHVKMIDFGLAKGGKDFVKNLSATREYASPEALGNLCTDERSDIYSFGATIRFLLSDPSEEMRIFLMKCLENDREKRIPNAKSALDELRKTVRRKKKDRKKKIIRLKIYISCFIIFFLLILSYLSWEAIKINKHERDIKELRNQAEMLPDENERREKIIELININDDASWFLKLVDEYRLDGNFDSVEAAEIEKIYKENLFFISESSLYPEICLTLGKTYLFYYESNSDISEREREVKSVIWFDEGSKAGDKEAADYASLIHFLLEINSYILEGKDAGKYRELFERIKSISLEAKSEDDFIKVNTYSICTDLIYAYCKDFYEEGITSDDMLTLLSETETDINLVSGGGVIVKEKKNEVAEKITLAKDEIIYIEKSYEKGEKNEN